jgi:uncharacterized protein
VLIFSHRDFHLGSIAANCCHKGSVLAKAGCRGNRANSPSRQVRFGLCLNPYPGGDVPADTGVCTDEIVRIYRAVGIDLQKEVHEDMIRNFNLYPHKWLTHPDPNIDHRRVPNLMTFFVRKGQTLPSTTRSADYSAGDIVAWDLGGGITHIGLVVSQRGPTGHYMVVHNIGRGPQMEDVLFDWKIIGHYRYYGPAMN